MIYDRVEDMLATTKRHPSIVRHRTGVTRDGRLAAMDIDVVLDGGAYCTLSPVVLSRGVHSRVGPVSLRPRAHPRPRDADQHAAERRVPRVRRAADAVCGRSAHGSHRRGARHRSGARCARSTRCSPATRRRPARGSAEDASALPVLREAVRRTRLHAEAQDVAGHQSRHRPVAVLPRLGLHRQRRGQAGVEGVARADRARRAHPGGSTEIGQGTRTMHAQIVADALGVPYDAVEVTDADTGRVPDSGPTVASRTCMIVGRLLQRCARRDARAARRRCRRRAYFRKHGPFVVTTQYERPPGLAWDDDQLSRRRLRQLRLGLQRRRARGRSRHVGGHARPR